MIAQGAMAFKSLRSPNTDSYGVLQILVILASIELVRNRVSSVGNSGNGLKTGYRLS
jgi:hypothetical protein